MNREKREASGSFFWDSGDAVGSFEKEEYVYGGCKFNNEITVCVSTSPFQEMTTLCRD
ncbi:Sucrase-Isomaltase, Intestinal [Manis pentadactyla]|nr:Sucrase-Isomaltase, Intestinal [Manis pentadactyla]